MRGPTRTVANGDSITLLVRRCFQCSAGKSKKVSNTSASFSRVSTAFGYFGPYSVANRVIASVAVGDGALGFWAAVRDVWPKTREQRDVDTEPSGTILRTLSGMA